MKAETVERREVYVRCPRCGDESSHRITHVSPGSRFGVSYCGNCGVGIEGFVGEEGGVEIAVADEGGDETYILVRVTAGEVPQFLMVLAPDDPNLAGYGACPPVKVREVAAIRYEGGREKLSSVKYVVASDSDLASGTGE